VKGARFALALACAGVVAAALAAPRVAEDRFREGTAAINKGDLPAGIAIYRELAASGAESAALYWNWAQAASARGSLGEALWAVLRARELDPGDGAIAREADRLRQDANLDPAEIAPEPLAGLARFERRFHVGQLALLLLAASVLFHGIARLRSVARWPVAAAWTSLALGLALAIVPVAASFAAPTAVVVRRGEPLLDAASPTANSLGTLREGEVVLVLAESGAYLRVRDSSGASGWVPVAGAWRLDRPPS